MKEREYNYRIKTINFLQRIAFIVILQPEKYSSDSSQYSEWSILVVNKSDKFMDTDFK